MADADVAKAVKDAGADPAARKELAEDPDKFFERYPNLTSDEKKSLRQLPAPEESPWPKSFKEVGALLLSAITVLFFAWAAWIFVQNIAAPPVFTPIPNTNPVQNVTVDPFDRVQIFFNAMLPLFGGLFAYWLGVQVEAKRADAAEKRAGDAAAGEKALLAASTPDVLRAAESRYPDLFKGGR